MTDTTNIQNPTAELAPADALIAAKEHAQKAWYLFTRERNLRAIVPEWRTTATPDGAPQLSVEVVGPGASHALRLFASQYHLALGGPGDQRPAFDYGTPGRTACVWRYRGVWVELWHPDTVPAAPTPPHGPARNASPQPAHRSFLRPGGRLPFTRRTTTKKENPTV